MTDILHTTGDPPTNRRITVTATKGTVVHIIIEGTDQTIEVRV